MAYADVHGGKKVERITADMEKRAVSAVAAAAALPWQTLQDTHTEVRYRYCTYHAQIYPHIPFK